LRILLLNDPVKKGIYNHKKKEEVNSKEEEFAQLSESKRLYSNSWNLYFVAKLNLLKTQIIQRTRLPHASKTFPHLAKKRNRCLLVIAKR
jgi:hypothetical protein